MFTAKQDANRQKTRNACSWHHRLLKLLGCSGLALAAVTCVPSSPVLASALIWSDSMVDWGAGRVPTFDSTINFFTIEDSFTVNGVVIRIRLTPIDLNSPGSNALDLLSSTNAPTGEQRFNNVIDPPASPPGAATGGAGTPSVLAIGYAGNDDMGQGLDTSVRIDILYEDPNGNPVQVEDVEIAVVDVDTDDGGAVINDWQDQVTAFAYDQNGSAAVLPSTLAGNSVGVTFSGLTPTNLASLSNAIPPPVTPTYTISGAGSNIATGDSAADAPNNGSNGNVFATYSAPITQARFDYEYGPLSQAMESIGHGIGLFNVFFRPVVIGTSKQVVGSPVDNMDGTFTITYQVVVENFGEVDLNNVSLVDDLVADGTFANADSFSVVPGSVSLVSSSRTTPTTGLVNTGYDGGVTDANLIANNVTLLARIVDSNTNAITTDGGQITVEFDVNVTPGSGANGSGPFVNQATATGTSPNGVMATDDSNDGANIDSNGDGSPLDNDVMTSVTLPGATPQPELTIVKRITNIFRGGGIVPLPVAGIGDFNPQIGETNDDALNAAFDAASSTATNQPAGIVELPAGFELEAGDEVEYTLFFWNSGGEDLTDVALCDVLQSPSSLAVAPMFALQDVGSLNLTTNPLDFDDAVGATIQSRSPLDPFDDALETGCESSAGAGQTQFGTGGGVVAGPFALPQNQFGAAQFRIQIP